MANISLTDNINWLLIRSSIVAKQDLIKIAEEYDLSLMQALTLCILEPGKPVAMSIVSDTFVCDPSNVTGIVERLSVGGYIERRESAKDRRVKTINLTESGYVLRLALIEKITAADVPNLENLTPEEVDQLRCLLTKALPNKALLKQIASKK